MKLLPLTLCVAFLVISASCARSPKLPEPSHTETTADDAGAPATISPAPTVTAAPFVPAPAEPPEVEHDGHG